VYCGQAVASEESEKGIGARRRLHASEIFGLRDIDYKLSHAELFSTHFQRDSELFQ